MPLLYSPERRARRRFFGLIGISLLLYVPQAILLLEPVLDKVHGDSPASWIPVPALNAFPRTVTQYFMNPALAVAVCLIILTAVLIRVRRDRIGWPSCGFLLGIGAAFVLFPFLISHVLSPVYVERYTIPALAAFLIALGWAVAVLPRVIRVIAVAGIVLLSAYTLREYYSGYDKDPFREAAQYVKERARPGDVVVCHAPYIERTFSYYFRPSEVIPIMAPWRESEVPIRFGDVSHVWLVQAYQAGDRNVIGPIIREASAGRVQRETVEIHGHGFKNPWAYHTARIQVTAFERTDAY